MSSSVMPWLAGDEPDESCIVPWMSAIYERYQNIEQARWTQGNIDSLFYAGEQNFVNSYFNFYPQTNFQQFYFNLIQQPINMVTGFQRQHRKSINFLPIEGSKQEFADDLTKCVSYANGYRGILEKFSIGCEQSAISGMVLAQPYLDFKDDPVNGTLDLKIWSYNSFLMDPFYRETSDMSDCSFIWTQQYITKKVAQQYFPNRTDEIKNMPFTYSRDGKFYFLPENYNISISGLLNLSYIWYKSSRSKKFLYNRNDGITYEFSDDDKYLNDLVLQTGVFEVISIDVPTWKVAVVLNERLMYKDFNPLKFDECPFVPIFWNYDPHIAQPDLRVRSLIRTMRDTQFLMNRRIILNHDISESSINSGYFRKEDAIVNEEDLRYSGQGKDIIIKQGYEMTDIQKIQPNAVPPSDMELANQLADFIFKTSGVNQELLGMPSDVESGIETILRQGAGLITLQKYFDQWDVSLKQIGKIEQKIIQNFWSPAKIGKILGKEPNFQFLNKTFSKYDVQVAEGLNTPVQQQQEFKQIVELNQMLGGIIPARFILEKATIQGKDQIIKAVDEQMQMAQKVQEQEAMLKQSLLEAQIQQTQARSVSDLAMAKERVGRADSNVGLFEERLSMISQNRSQALKTRVEALKNLIEITQMASPQLVDKEEDRIDEMQFKAAISEDIEKEEALEESNSNDFMTNLMQNNQNPNNMMNEQRSPLL